MKKINILFTLLIIPFLALAQENESKEEVSKTIDLTEVTIKAEKVERKLQEAPISASILEVKKVEQENITTMAELTARVPNFFVLDYGSRMSPQIFIRGMGLRRDAQPSVGVYVDNIPFLEKGSFNFEFVDIENIEVLRGPQGTLYGRNTMGGLIKVYTQEPKALFSAYIKSELGNYNQQKHMLHVNVPINNKFYSVINAAYFKGDGFFTNQFSGKQADEYDRYAARLKFAYRPNNNFKSTLSIDFERNNELGYAYATYNTLSQTANAVNYNGESGYDRDRLSIGLNIENIGEDFVFSSSTSYQMLDDLFMIDQDFSPVDLYFINQDRKHHTIYQEFNLHSKAESKHKWLVGAMFFKQFTDKGVNVNFGTPFIQRMSLPFQTYSYLKTYDQTSSGLAFYSQGTLSLGDFNFTGGIRVDFNLSDLDYGYVKTINGGDFEQPGFSSRLGYERFTPKFSLSYTPEDYFTAFFTATTGFKAGDFNFTFETDEDKAYDPEKSVNLEFGFKTSWFNKKVIANLSFFFIDIDNQQVNVPVPSGQGSMIKNAAKAISRGLEFELNAMITKNWNVFSAFGYTNAKFDNYENTDGLKLGGYYTPNIPKYTLNIGTNYTFDFTGFIIDKAHINLNYQHIGKIYWEETNADYQGDYGIANAKVSFETKMIDFGFWAKNIFDTDYNAFYFTSFDIAYVQLGKPAQFGVFAKIKIK